MLDYLNNEKRKFEIKRGNSHNISITNNNKALYCMDVLVKIKEGIKEQSIISQYGDHYNTIHPTQKPIRLLERLLNLVSGYDDVVLDPFSGSGSTACACLNTNRKFIGFEIDKEYFDLSNKRINEMFGLFSPMYSAYL